MTCPFICFIWMCSRFDRFSGFPDLILLLNILPMYWGQSTELALQINGIHRRCGTTTFLCLLMGWIAVLPTLAGTHVRFRTVFGDMDVDLMDEDKPATVANFKRYVESGRYTNMFFHRLDPGFVVQGGGFGVTNRGTAQRALFAVPIFGTVTNEFNVGPKVSNTRGTIAMAKVGGDPNSASSQWFFNCRDNSANLDNQNGGFTVFGRIIRGDDVLEILSTFSKTTRATNVVVNAGAPFFELPQLVPPTNDDAFYSGLVFVDITLLSVDVQRRADGGFEISWESVPGTFNVVEYTTVLPPVWETLAELADPPPGRASIDDGTAEGFRFYRVRIPPDASDSDAP
jgi:cyclophilin family peptidyl-prolyl cis-trans isomerase